MPGLRRILFVTHNYPPLPGGISSFSYDITEALAKHGYEVRVLAPVSFSHITSAGVERISIKEGSIRKLRRFAIIPLLQRELDRKPDLVYLSSLQPYGPFVRFFCARRGVPYILESYGSEVLRLMRGQNWLGIESHQARQTIRQARAVICISQYTADLNQQFMGHKLPTHVIHLALDSQKFQPGTKDPEALSRRLGRDCRHAFAMLSVSRMTERKGHVQVLKALRLLALRFPQLIYLIGGDGAELPRLEQQAEELGVRDRVFFLGNLTDSLVFHYQNADLFILTSRDMPGGDVESFGLVYIEANACGLPVIAGRTGGVPDAVKDGVTGFLVDSENPEEIARQIERLITDDDLRRKMSEAGLQWGLEHDWSCLIGRYIAVMEGAIR